MVDSSREVDFLNVAKLNNVSQGSTEDSLDLFAWANLFDNDEFFLSWIEYYKPFFGTISTKGTKC